MRQIFALLILATQIAQCETIEVTESQNATVRIGDTIIIRLRENPTTGYSWQMDFPHSDVIKVQENKYIAPNTTLVGAGGERKCVIEAQKAGTVEITGTYRRRWEKNVQPARIFKCIVTVKNDDLSLTSRLFSRIRQALNWLHR